jgi:benzoyl-CoA reductase/2-hydroxyglutaryl-CoA dehydratase subunit BcrC/BadD/HgdB
MDSKWGEFPKYLPERVHYLGAQIDQALEKAEKVLDINISVDAWEKSQKDTRAFINNLQRLIDLMKANPVPVSAVEIELLEAIPGASTAKGIREGIKALGILVNELEGRVKAGTGVTEKGAPRVMTMVAGNTSDPRVTRLPEDAGLAVASTMLLSWLGGPGSTFRPGENYTTPGEKIADYELAVGNFHGTDGAIKLFETGTKVMKLDGLIVNYLYNCRPGGHLSHIPKKYLEEKTGLPVLSLEIDGFDSRAYSAASLRTKVETFADMLKAKKASAMA